MSINLDPACVLLDADIDDRYDAIVTAGQLLVAAGCIAPRYVDSLLARERTATTYLGAGVAIPHGMVADRDAIQRTGIAVVRLLKPVAWATGRGSARDAIHFGAADAAGHGDVDTRVDHPDAMTGAGGIVRDRRGSRDALSDQATTVFEDRDEPVRLVVAIAAASGEHLLVLQQLTRMIGDPERLAAAMGAPDPVRMIESIVGARSGTPRSQGAATGTADFSLRRTIRLDYPNGLHARPAGAWAACAARFQARLRVRHGAAIADARSLIELLQLGATADAELVLSAHGEDAADALAALADTIAFLRAEERQRASATGMSAGTAGSAADGATDRRALTGRKPLRWTPLDPARAFDGIGVGAGLAIGTVRRARPAADEIDDVPQGTARDGAALDAALQRTIEELGHLAVQTSKRLGHAQGEIFSAQAAFLDHGPLLADAAGRILDGHGAAWSWREAISDQAAKLAALPDPLLAARAADLCDVGDRVLRHLCSEPDAHGLANAAAAARDADAPAILLAEDLAPSDAVALDPAHTVGFCTASGGPTSHTAILARTLGLPAVVACGDAVLTLADGATVVVDGDAGRLYADLSERDLTRALAAQRDARARVASVARDCLLPARTRDGRHIEIGVNVTRPEQVAPALAAGADGVGLMRTEFLFLGRARAPSEDEQFDSYRALVEASDGRRLIIRTLDIGGDKQVPYLDLPHEANPFLGVRGLRLCLRRPELFLPQLRALYRAAQLGPLSIMFPMVSDLDEARRAVQLAEMVRCELDAPRVPLGIMVETPSAALLAEVFAGIVDFFSIGTNDLTQYTLAIDREHPTLAAQADSLHPAVLRLIEQTVDGARRGGAWVGVCGGLAGEPLGAAILAGLGVDEISMSVGDLPSVKAGIRRASMPALRALAQRALRCDDVAQVRALGHEELLDECFGLADRDVGAPDGIADRATETARMARETRRGVDDRYASSGQNSVAAAGGAQPSGSRGSEVGATTVRGGDAQALEAAAGPASARLDRAFADERS